MLQQMLRLSKKISLNEIFRQKEETYLTMRSKEFRNSAVFGAVSIDRTERGD